MLEQRGVLLEAEPAGEARMTRDDLLLELYGLCSLDLDGRDYLTMWLVSDIKAVLISLVDEHGVYSSFADGQARPDARPLPGSVTRGHLV